MKPYIHARFIALTMVRPLKVRGPYLSMLWFSMVRVPLNSSRTIHDLCHHPGQPSQSHLTEVYSKRSLLLGASIRPRGIFATMLQPLSIVIDWFSLDQVGLSRFSGLPRNNEPSPTQVRSSL